MNWEGSNISDEYPFVVNGVYEDSDGDLYALGTDRSNSPTADSLQIYQLNSDGSISQEAELASYNDFNSHVGEITSANYFYYLLGLYPVDGNIISIQFLDQVSGYGQIHFFNGSGSSWSLDGSSIHSDGTTDFSYLVPIGILPDNKFYCFEDTITDTNKKTVIRVDDPDSKSISVFDVFSNFGEASVENSLYYYYYESGV